jgi:hypothetical protein
VHRAAAAGTGGSSSTPHGATHRPRDRAFAREVVAQEREPALDARAHVSSGAFVALRLAQRQSRVVSTTALRGLGKRRRPRARFRLLALEQSARARPCSLSFYARASTSLHAIASTLAARVRTTRATTRADRAFARRVLERCEPSLLSTSRAMSASNTSRARAARGGVTQQVSGSSACGIGRRH